MRALITGLAGFAGSHLAEYLVNQPGVDVWGIVRADESNVAHLRPKLHIERGDLRDYDTVVAIFRQVRPDSVFHLAGQSAVGLSWRDPWRTLETNVRAQVNVLQVAADVVPEARILVVGSNEEYGRVAPDELPIDEATPLRPDSPYGVSKIAQDMLGLQYHLSHGLHTVRVRPFNHIGPRQREGFIAPDFARQIAEIEAGLHPPVIRVGNLTTRRDFTDVRDVVRAYWLVLQHGQAGDVYNVGSGVARSAQDVLTGLLRLTEAEIAIEEDPTRLRPSDVPVSLCDASKLRDLTGWQPTIPFEQSLRDVLDDWRMRVRAGVKREA